MRTDDFDAVKEKLYSESEPFLVAHPDYDLSKLPSFDESFFEDVPITDSTIIKPSLSTLMKLF